MDTSCQPDLLNPNEHKYFTDFLNFLVFDTNTSNDYILPPSSKIRPQDKNPCTPQLSSPAPATQLTPLSERKPAFTSLEPTYLDSCLKNKSRENEELSNSNKKPKREPLSEETKKRNHVASEQKRRQLIKEGFEALSKNVPLLSNNSESHSKSEILQKTLDYVHHLKAENEALKSRLQTLEDHYSGLLQRSMTSLSTINHSLLVPSLSLSNIIIPEELATQNPPHKLKE